jgi:2-polyprenyl-3-methyl-5-hydroxy-6-metoxy-1,4-benzoquinol methylase
MTTNITNGALTSARDCPFCAGSGFRPFKLGLLQCDGCELVLSPVIWQAQANEQMEDAYFGEDYKARKSSFWVEWFEARNNRKTLSRLAALPLPGKRLLEIGVGSGSFLQRARERGYTVMGCDLSVPLCRRVEQSLGVTMFCGPLIELKGEARFDVVVMNHVLEHVQDPVAFLQEVLRLLVSGGFVHIAAPNIACWQARLSGWTSYEPYHLAYFDRNTLSKAVDGAGFVRHDMFSRDSFSGWFLALLRTALGVGRSRSAVAGPDSNPQQTDRTQRRASIIEHGYRFAMVLAGGGTWPLRWVQGRLGYSDEIICLARKPVAVQGE